MTTTKYYLLLQQAGEGCDYMIGCGMTLRELAAQTDAEASAEITALFFKPQCSTMRWADGQPRPCKDAPDCGCKPLLAFREGTRSTDEGLRDLANVWLIPATSLGPIPKEFVLSRLAQAREQQRAREAENARAVKELSDRAEYERLRAKFEGNNG